MNKNGVIAVVVVIAAVVLVGLWVMRGGQEQRARLECAAPPAAPAGLNYSTQGSLVTLTWAAPDEGTDLPTTYVIEAGSESGAANQGTFVTPGTATNFQREAGPGTYYVRMMARNACGTSPASPEIVVTVQ